MHRKVKERSSPICIKRSMRVIPELHHASRESFLNLPLRIKILVLILQYASRGHSRTPPRIKKSKRVLSDPLICIERSKRGHPNMYQEIKRGLPIRIKRSCIKILSPNTPICIERSKRGYGNDIPLHQEVKESHSRTLQYASRESFLNTSPTSRYYS
jgi:hypothetical protein